MNAKASSIIITFMLMVLIVACKSNDITPYSVIEIESTGQRVWSYSILSSISKTPLNKYGLVSIEGDNFVILENGVKVRYSKGQLTVDDRIIPGNVMNCVVSKGCVVKLHEFIRTFE